MINTVHCKAFYSVKPMDWLFSLNNNTVQCNGSGIKGRMAFVSHDAGLVFHLLVPFQLRPVVPSSLFLGNVSITTEQEQLGLRPIQQLGQGQYISF